MVRERNKKKTTENYVERLHQEMNKQIIINVVKYDVRDKLESDNIRFRCHIMHNPCKAKT